MAETDKDWQEEQDRVRFVIHEIKRKLKKIKERTSDLKDRVIDLRKNFWDDVTVNLDEIDDVIETQASLKQQAEFLSERERSHGQLSQQLKTLQRLQESPYFGRIDFQEEGESKLESIYIGIASMMDKHDEDFLIYDWRAPISSLYYDYPPGEAEYKTMDGTIHGEITLKRQFIIRNQEIKGMFDTGLTIGDHLLQAVLGNNANTKMKSIVATIQKEQNKIIRNEKSKLLIVQGVAGSGKTSAALQRVAYLLYRYRETLSADNMVLFSPNPLFNSYVATVLPELGEENMKQTTFHEYLVRRLGKQFSLESPFEQMEYYLTESDQDTYQARLAGIQWKASLDHKQQIDRYVDDLGKKGIQFRNISFRGQKLISSAKIRDYFYSLDHTMSIPNRLEEVSKWLMEKIKVFEQNERKEDWVLEESQLLDKEDFLQVYQEMQDEDEYSDDPFFNYAREEQLLRKKVVSDKLKPLKRKVKKFFFLDVRKTYTKLFELEKYKVKQVPLWDEIAALTIEQLKKKSLTWEDATPYLYFQDKLLGYRENTAIQHVFIDEAQDYSPFQFAYFRQVYPNSRMTLLGDINQAIYAHALHSDTLLTSEVEEKQERITLQRSYRSTKPIVEFTKSFMPNGDQIEAFNREGEKPKVYEVDDDYTRNQMLVNHLEEWQKEYQTIAVICKTKQESLDVYNRLNSSLPVKLIDEETFTFQKGLVVIPAYLAKGIEFDAVIVFDASNDQYDTELEKNLFYTACTRAMHALTVFSLGPYNRFIEEIPDEYFHHYKVHSYYRKQ
ncbi:AAA family ATPase [Radiobacillus kanasensis]|uniref:RNA polymerase recycling motor HelD n=1 Tax=Radiobacillus kanasensis TaxID=2844358 RepID=UPI001E4AADE8|nr:RNA polymerase recycling motor HelD [Radiobacillus kanasensis]UFT99108.1 AAA family ATPase [Radiobacillus kanasensis]